MIEFLVINKDFFINNKEALDVMLRVFTVLITLGTLCWTFFSGLKTFKNYTLNKKSEQISRLIQLFAEENKIKRMSSVNALAGYCDSLFNEIFLLCVIENNYHIKLTLQNALCKNGKKCYDQAIKLNSFYVRILLGFQNNKQNGYLCKEEWDSLIHYHKELRIDSEIYCKSQIENNLEIHDYNDILQYIILASKIIITNLKFKELKGLMIVLSDFHKKKIIIKNIFDCIFQNNIYRHAIIKKTTFTNCCFTRSNDFYDAKFNSVRLIKSKFKKCEFRSSHFANSCKFIDTIFDSCIFSESIHKGTSITNSILKNCKLKGAKFYNLSNAQKSNMINCELHGSFFYECGFSKSSYFSSNFLASEFINSSFRGLRFCRCDLSFVVFKKCNFENINFAGSDLKNVEFVECNFADNISFKGAKNIETIKDKNCIGFDSIQK
ncbi:MAG: pentapeptide repeat-containing protein [Treponema sp.]|jgi:uncharacterized protein YjbI with pentapeptide repeats|nr:pentapeptide repeat-containing protein [Treponema sp.]